MTLHEYRVETSLATFNAYGRLEQVEGIHLVRLSVSYDQSKAVENDLRKSLNVALFAIVGGELVLPAKVFKVRARPDGPRVELACLVLA